MTYYIAEIRFNRKSRSSKRDGRIRKRLILHFVTLLLVSLLVSASIIIIQVAACRNKHHCDDCFYCDDDDWFDCDDDDYDGCEERWRIRRLVIKCLKELKCEISGLPDEAFENSEHVDCKRKMLRWKVCVVIWQVFVGAYEGALNKLENDVKERIEQWIADCWKTGLIEKVDYIIELIKKLLCRKDWWPPKILGVLQYPKIPNYDESVTVIAHVVDYHCSCGYMQSGVKSAILSYSVDLSGWSNVTMNLVDGLYFGEIQSLPYNTTVNYKIYAYDWACNLAISKLYSYVVADSYPPLISYVDRVPPSPYYNKTVSIFANVTEPPEASGVKNVTLLYRVDGEWQLVEMTLEDTLYNMVIPAFPYGTTVQYKIRASDWAENRATSGIYSYTVGAPPNLPPVAKFTESEETVLPGVVIYFNASASYDPDGYIVGYFWDFGDGMNATGVTVDHAYATTGTYTVTLTVTDDDGAVGSASSTKTVVPNQPPVALFTESATKVLTNEVISFDASLSYDPDGEIFSHFWDFGDETNATGKLVEHAYADDGAYIVTLTVTDDYGATASVTSTKCVENRPPVAFFAESAETVDTNEVITFDASASYDPDGNIANYTWNFGDGTNATGVTVSHRYADDGSYNIILTVIDDDGAMATEISTKTVLNRSPVALFTESATTLLTHEVIHFDASSSNDLDGSIIIYIWDFGDGSEATDVTANHAYEDNGVYNVTLTVIDDDGAIASKSTSKTVSNRPPVASFTENVTTVDAGEAIHFDASNSSDSDGFIVSYFWDFGDGTNATGVTVDHAYDEAGNYTVTLTVTDDDGAIGNDTSVKTVLEGEAEVGWALFAALGLSLVALIATIIYLWYRRRRKRSAAGAAASSSARPLITLYIPASILAGYE